MADKPLLDFSVPEGFATHPVDVVVGYSFIVDQPITVSSLMVWDEGDNGLVESSEVGLWTGSGDQLLASTTIASGTAAPAVMSASGLGSWRYSAVSPLVLAAGTYVVGAKIARVTDEIRHGMENATMDSGCSYNDGRAELSDTFVFPTMTGSSLGQADDLFGANVGLMETMVIHSSGPFAGGHSILVTNASPAIGDGADITNVVVGGVGTTNITGQGANWVSFIAPIIGRTGRKDVGIQSSSEGETTLSNAFTVNQPGLIGNETLPGVVYMTNAWFNGNNGVLMMGAVSFDLSGWSVSGAGAVNGDGLDDLMVGAFQYSSLRGATYLVYGRRGGLPSWITLTNTWCDGTNGVMLVGLTVGDRSSYSLRDAGDINGDGWDDLLIGAYLADPGGLSGAGETYLVYGRSSGLPAWIPLTNAWFDGTNGVLLAGASGGDFSGCAVSDAGDVNGDGFADLLIGANQADPDGIVATGATYLVYGRGGFSPGVEPASGSSMGGYQVVITGVNLGNGTDITNVTLCGASAANIASQSDTQVVIVAGGGAAGLGSVRVFSTSYGETVKSNAFTYLRATQAPLVFTPTSPQAYCSTNALSVSGGSGIGAVSYSVLSGPGAIVDDTNLNVTASSGAIEIRATKAQDDLYYEASVTGAVTATKALAGVYLHDLAQLYDGAARNVTATTDPSGLLVEFTYDGNAWAPTNAGSYVVTGIVNDANWAGSADDTLVVSKARQSPASCRPMAACSWRQRRWGSRPPQPAAWT